MSTFQEVDPTSFINEVKQLPENGRGAWTTRGIGFSRFYKLSPKGVPRIGSECEKSLDHWAVGAGTHAMRQRLVELELIDEATGENVGRYGTGMRDSVKAFQAANVDPVDDVQLNADGVVGFGTVRAMFTPVIDEASDAKNIPNNYLRGVLWHESWLDPGAVGYYIYYINYDGTTRYGGVDRGLEQNNSRANTSVSWETAYDFRWSIEDAAKRLRGQYEKLKAKYPNRGDDVLWPAAIVSHNSPANGDSWARLGAPPTTQAAEYVQSVLKAIY